MPSPAGSPMALWCAAVCKLEQAVTELEQTGSFVSETVESLQSHLEALDVLPPLQAYKAEVLQALVLRMQIPKRIAAAASKSLELGGQLLSPVVMEAVHLAQHLLSAELYQVSFFNQPKGRASGGTLDSMWQQLEAMRRLEPQILEAAAAAVASAASKARRTDSEQLRLITVLFCGRRLLELQQMHYFQRAAPLAGVAAAAASLGPSMQFAVAAARLLSANLPQQEQQQGSSRQRRQRQQQQHAWKQHGRLHSPCAQIIHSAGTVAAAFVRLHEAVASTQHTPQLDAIYASALVSPHISPGLALILAADTFHLAAVQHLAAISSGTSSTRSWVSPSETAWAQAAALLAVEGVLTPLHHQLFVQVGGVDTRAVAWGATYVAKEEALTAVDFFNQVPCLVQCMVDQKHSGSTEEQAQKHRSLLLLMAGLVMHAAAQLPERVSLSQDQQMELADTAVHSSNRLLNAWIRMTHHDAHEQQQEQREQRGQEQKQEQPDNPARWLFLMLPAVLHVGSCLLQLVFPKDGPAAAGSAAADVSSSSGSGSSRSGGAAADKQTSPLLEVCGLLSVILKIGDDRMQRAGLGEEVEQWLQPYAADILTVAEGVVRATAAAVAAGRTTVNPLLLDTLYVLLGCRQDASSERRGVLLRLAVAGGPDSSALRNMYSLMASICKLASLLAPQAEHPTAESAAESEAAAAAAAEAAEGGEEVSDSNRQMAKLCLQCVCEASTALLRLSTCPEPAAGTVVQLVPVLVLHRRVLPMCLSLSPNWRRLAPIERAYERMLLDWLQGERVSAELSAAGYQHQQLVEATAQLLAALDEAGAAAEQAAGSEAAGPEDIAAVQAAANAAVAVFQDTLPTDAFCNNPDCVNVGGPTERAAASGSKKKCSGCRVARYCSQACQHAHWRAHRPVCKALKKAAAEAAAAAAATGGG